MLFGAPIWVFCLISLLIQAGAHNNDCVYVKEIQSISCASGKGMNEYGNTKCLFMTKENMWKQSKYERKQKKAIITPIFEETKCHFKKDKNEYLRNYRPVSLTSVPVKVMEQVILENISKHVKDKKVTQSSQQGFTLWKSHN